MAEGQAYITEIMIMAPVSQFNLACYLIKAHHKTIYEDKIVCIKDKIERSDPFLLGLENSPSAGFIAQFSSLIAKFLLYNLSDKSRTILDYNFDMKSIRISICMASTIR